MVVFIASMSWIQSLQLPEDSAPGFLFFFRIGDTRNRLATRQKIDALNSSNRRCPMPSTSCSLSFPIAVLQSPFLGQTKNERAQPLDVQPLPQNTATHLKRCCPISAAGAVTCLHLLTFGETVSGAAMCCAGRHGMRSGKEGHV